MSSGYGWATSLALALALAIAGGCGDKDDDGSSGSSADAEAAKKALWPLRLALGDHGEDSSGVLPDKLEALVIEGEVEQKDILTLDGKPLTYIEGQSLNDPPENVLVYDARPIYDGKCLVLLVGGNILLMDTDALVAARDKTTDYLEAAKKKSGDRSGIFEEGDLDD